MLPVHWKYLCYFYLHSKWQLKTFFLKHDLLKQGSGPQEMLCYKLSKVCGNVQCIYNYSMNRHLKDKQYLRALVRLLRSLGFVQHKEIICQINSSHKTLWDLQLHEEWNAFHEFFHHSASYSGPRPMAPLPSVHHNPDPSSLLKQAQAALGFQAKKTKDSQSEALKKLERFGFLQKPEFLQAREV